MSASTTSRQGPISPASAFVDPHSGMLMPVNFRFLQDLFFQIQTLQSQVASLTARLNATPGAPPP